MLTSKEHKIVASPNSISSFFATSNFDIFDVFNKLGSIIFPNIPKLVFLYIIPIVSLFSIVP